MRFDLLSKTKSRRCAGPSTRSVCTLSQGAPRGIWSAKSPAGAEHRDCKASATAWIVACSCASGPAVNADWAALPGASAEGRAVSRISRETSENCTTKPFSNSRDHASGKSPASCTRKEQRRDITAVNEIKCKVESFTVEVGFFQELLRKLAGEVPKNLRERKISFLCGCCSYDLVRQANGPCAILLNF